ncbi:hypothetical protein MJO28_004218, partial [Puccinia striiformis f. sp. tritici]
ADCQSTFDTKISNSSETYFDRVVSGLYHLTHLHCCLLGTSSHIVPLAFPHLEATLPPSTKPDSILRRHTSPSCSPNPPPWCCFLLCSCKWPPVALLSAPPAGIGRRQSSLSSSTSTVSVFVQQWSEVRTQFGRCSNVFNSGASVEVAITSVKTLYQSCSTVANQYSTCNGCADAASSQVVTAFKSSIEVSFQTWQQILTVGQQRYASVWKSHCFPTILYLGHGREDRMLVPQSPVGCDLKESQLELKPLPWHQHQPIRSPRRHPWRAWISRRWSPWPQRDRAFGIELFASPEASYADGDRNYDLSICLTWGLCIPLPTDISI